MADVIIMPKLGFNQEEGQLVAWHKKAGDTVAKGEVLFEINTDKTTMPIEATRDGILLKVLVAEGDSVPVFTPVAVVGNAGEDPDAALNDVGGGQAAVCAEKPSGLPAPGKMEPSAARAAEQDMRLSPKARKLLRDRGIDPATIRNIAGTGFRGGITAADILKAGLDGRAVKASPVARKMADHMGLDLSGVAGSGPGGKVMKADVPPVQTDALYADEGGRMVLRTAAYDGVRRIIGDRLFHSAATAPHIYFADSADMTAFTAFRKQINEYGDTPVAMSDLLVLAVSKTLQKYPEVNSSLVNGQVVTYKSVNIGIAVAGAKGLMVPVVRNTQDKTLAAIARETRDLVARGKQGNLAPDEYSGGTFTISNLGMFGIESFTAIINPPESAILAVAAIRREAVVVTDRNGEESVAVRPIMRYQLSVDHRLIDGLLAATFMAHLKKLLLNPALLLL